MEPEGEPSSSIKYHNTQSDKPCIRLKNLSIGWSDEKMTLKNIDLTVANNELVGVVGAIGSGKTSLLMAILNEVPIVKCDDLTVNGSVFYVSQEPWIFSATVKQNILFGKPYDKKKFDKIAKLCCLDEVSIEWPPLTH